MKYKKIVEGKFLERPNRFVAYVEIQGQIEKVHVKNTGRCRELLIPNARLILEDCSHIKTRKTRYSIIAVYKGNKLINMDSQVPNQVVYDGISQGLVEELGQVENLKREVGYLNSRFDIYFEKNGIKSFLEVKGVTLEEARLAKFPDAPTSRGKKHILELIKAKEAGYGAYIFFLIQMEDVEAFSPNWKMDRDFSQALELAYKSGVEILVYNSKVSKDSIELLEKIDFRL